MKRFRTRITVIATVFVVAGGAGVFHLESAYAAPIRCASGKICFYPNFNNSTDAYGGTPFTVGYQTGCVAFPAYMRDNAEYVINNSSYRWKIYDWVKCNTQGKNSYVPEWGAGHLDPLAWENRITSIRVDTSPLPLP